MNEFKVGDRVTSIYGGKKHRIGTILKVEYLGNDLDYHVKWESGLLRRYMASELIPIGVVTGMLDLKDFRPGDFVRVADNYPDILNIKEKIGHVVSEEKALCRCCVNVQFPPSEQVELFSPCFLQKAGLTLEGNYSID